MSIYIFQHSSDMPKSLKNYQDFCLKTKTETKTSVYVLEAPRDQDPSLEDYTTGYLNQIWYRTQIPHYQHTGMAKFT